ncbi:MAG: hypothetical protein NC213_08060 [Acetobacter sp.]|nr:hypothetical protein [Bacteroides sp.]MCM1341683.1 hypothetical protein [Acetobacter sp.]MCM1432379.1 hypothetical protein [Clostridiales bacterium]
MDKLIEKLETLINKDDKDEIQKMLLKIGSELLTKYEIRVDNIIIEPLRVEPYLFIPNVFEDKFIHSENGEYGPHQRNRFGKLYIHKGFSGVDIVLSNKDEYAFSFLIKNSRILIDNEVAYPFLKQYGVAKILKEHGIQNNYDDVVLYKKESAKDTIVFRTVRKGLKIAERKGFDKPKQEYYSKLVISSLIELEECSSSQYDFETGYGKLWTIANYLYDHSEKNNAEWIHQVLGYNGFNEINKYLSEIIKEREVN